MLIILASCNKYESENSIVVTKSTKNTSTLQSDSCFYNYWTLQGISCNTLKHTKGGDAKLAKCQINDEVLKEMSDRELAIVCYSYPLFFEYLFSDDESYAIHFMIENFNGLIELSTRKTGTAELISLLNNNNQLSIESQYKDAYIELLLTDDLFFSKLEYGQLQEISSILNKKESMINAYEGDVPIINQKRAINLNSKIFNSVFTVNSICNSPLFTIYTPFGKNIEAFQISTEYSQAEINYINNTILANYDVIIIGDASPKYNCHAYAWASTAQAWINNNKSSGGANISLYWTNDLYHQSNINKKNKIHYYAGDHSAITDYLSSNYISKWGSQSLVKHNPTEVPSSYQPSLRHYYNPPYIIGEETANRGVEYTYTIYPYMSYASYTWEIDIEEEKYQIISMSGNSLTVKFLRSAIFDIYGHIKISSGLTVYSTMLEVLVEE